MLLRFGSGRQGRAARTMAAFTYIVITVAMVVFFFTAGGKFLAEFLPFTPLQCTLGIALIAFGYTLVGGLYGVVWTDVFQAVIIGGAAICLSVVAVQRWYDGIAAKTCVRRTAGALSCFAAKPGGEETLNIVPYPGPAASTTRSGRILWTISAYGQQWSPCNTRGREGFVVSGRSRVAVGNRQLAEQPVRDPFFGPNRTGKGAPYNVYHGNLRDSKGTGWISQGFTDLETFDFSRANLGWDNDYYTRDFVNYNLAIEQVFWRGRAGFELAYDYQDLYRRNYTAFNGANAEVMFDINETLWLPADPNYRSSGNVTPMPNPNYGRPFVLTKAGRRTIDTQREAARFTGFIKHDFAERRPHSLLARILGRHTLTGMADRSTHDEKLINYVLNSFGDPEPALHIGPANARQTANSARNVPIYAQPGGAGTKNPPGNPKFEVRNPKLQARSFKLGFSNLGFVWPLVSAIWIFPSLFRISSFVLWNSNRAHFAQDFVGK